MSEFPKRLHWNFGNAYIISKTSNFYYLEASVGWVEERNRPLFMWNGGLQRSSFLCGMVGCSEAPTHPTLARANT
jgi:hypothetical protein